MRQIGLLELMGFAMMAAAALSGLAGPGLASGTKSGDGACAQLAAEQRSLVDLGVKRNMEKGPEWARVNLSQGELNLIQYFIGVSERIKFHCMPPKAVLHLRIEDAAGESDDEDAPAKGEPRAAGDSGAEGEKADEAAMPPLPGKRGKAPVAKKQAAKELKKPREPKSALAKKAP
jgi:hypothetical protein